MMLALVTAVTRFRLCLIAYSKANFAMRRVPVREIGLIEILASGKIFPLDQEIISCASFESFRYSTPAYRSSVFSRTNTMSTFSYRDLTPLKDLQGLRQAYKLSSFRSATLME